MSIENSAALETSGTGRRIDSDRIQRALTEHMTVADHGPNQYLVARDGDNHDDHLVDVAAGACDCEDSFYREVVCVHLVRAAVHHAFRSAGNTHLVARVLRAVGDVGCPHDVRGCAGPTTIGARGYPCTGCVDSVSAGDWTVWTALVRDSEGKQ